MSIEAVRHTLCINCMISDILQGCGISIITRPHSRLSSYFAFDLCEFFDNKTNHNYESVAFILFDRIGYN
jgi:hypothetical protein